MSENPIINALLAATYITVIALVMSQIEHQGVEPHPVIGVAAFLSLLVLSVVTMGYLFFGQPVQLYLEGQRKEAVLLFVKTLLVFSVCVVLFFVIAFFTY